ncbi:acyltransferase [Eisenbergiella sp.]
MSKLKGIIKSIISGGGVIEKCRKHGMNIGANTFIYSSNIDYGHAFLISVGDNCTITGATLLAHDATTKKQLGYVKVGRINIGNNVFIGQGAIVLPGVTVEDNVIIGAGTVVSRSIPSNSVVVGNPARIIGKTTDYMQKHENRIKKNPELVWKTYCADKSTEEKMEMRQKLENNIIGYDN